MSPRRPLLTVAVVALAVTVGLGLGNLAERDTRDARAAAGQAHSQVHAARADAAAAQAHADELAAAVRGLTEAAGAADDLGEQLTRLSLAGRLTGTRVTVLALPGGEAEVDRLVGLLTSAGASAHGRLALAGPAAVDAERVCADVDAVVILGAAAAAPSSGAVLDLVAGIARLAPVVVGGPLAAAARSDPRLAAGPTSSAASAVSTVDEVGTPLGRLAVAWALADLVESGTVGHYGEPASPPGVAAVPAG